jgi:hypothetical protein
VVVFGSVKKTDWGRGVMAVKKTSLQLPEAIWKSVKIRAVEEGRNVQELVAEALKDYLRKKGGSRAK